MFVRCIFPKSSHIYIRTQDLDNTALTETYISAIRTIFGVVSIAQLVEMADSAVLGGVVDVVSSNPTMGHENIF